MLSQENEPDGDCLAKELSNTDRKYLRTVHRLDRVVSGCICVGKSSKATTRLSEMFRNRFKVEKRYFAVVKGILKNTKDYETRLEMKMLPGKGRRGITTKSSSRNSREAVLTYRIVSDITVHNEVTSTPCTLLDIHLITGIKHQIRAQLAEIGHPILGDTRYDSENSLSTRRNNEGIIALHAYYLSFEHPVAGHDSPVEARCDIPWEIWKSKLGLSPSFH